MNKNDKIIEDVKLLMSEALNLYEIVGKNYFTGQKNTTILMLACFMLSDFEKQTKVKIDYENLKIIIEHLNNIN